VFTRLEDAVADSGEVGNLVAKEVHLVTEGDLLLRGAAAQRVIGYLKPQAPGAERRLAVGAKRAIRARPQVTHGGPDRIPGNQPPVRTRAVSSLLSRGWG